AQIGGDGLVKTRKLLWVLAQVGRLIDFQPLKEEVANLRVSARVREHPLGLLHDLLPRRQLALFCSFQQLGVGQRIPKRKRDSGGHVIGIGGRADFPVEKSRRLQHEYDHATNREVRLMNRLKRMLYVKLLLLRGKRTPERSLRKSLAKVA